jgi:hypothetical protein
MISNLSNMIKKANFFRKFNCNSKVITRTIAMIIVIVNPDYSAYNIYGFILFYYYISTIKNILN